MGTMVLDNIAKCILSVKRLKLNMRSHLLNTRQRIPGRKELYGREMSRS